ncbi:VMAP-C domain-containing protein [Actinoallomurus acanthiterrae]
MTGTESGSSVPRIADALEGISLMLDRSVRDAMVDFIGRELDGPLNVRDSDYAKIHLYNLVAACADRPGAFQAMVRFLDHVAGDLPGTALVRRMISPVAEALPTADCTAVRRLLEGRTIPQLTRIFCIACGGSVPPPGHLNDAWEAFSILLDMNARPDGTPPHLLFAALFAQAPEAKGVAEGLRAWIVDQAMLLRAAGAEEAADSLLAIRDRTWPAAGLPLHLIIMIEPSLTEGPGGFLITHWRQFHPAEWRPEPAGRETRCGFDDIPGGVADLIREAVSGWASQFNDPLTIEFVLPSELINLDVDQWLREPPDDQSVPIGAEFEVVVRSRDRLSETSWHHAWRRRSRMLADPSHDCRIHPTPPDMNGDPRKFRVYLDQATAVACILDSSPDEEPGRSQLKASLRAGLPVVLWCRDRRSAADFGAAVAAINARRLPPEIKRLRQNAIIAEGTGSTYGQHISLLWDDHGHFLDVNARIRLP